MAKLFNKTKNQVLAEKLDIATSFVARSKGLLTHTHLAQDEGLWIKPCGSIHTFFMKFTIDAAFVDRDLKVQAVYRKLRPWKLAWPMSFAAQSVFELSSGRLDETRTEIGDQLYVVTENS
jgi:uncharacterized membrane protein (UPF0127 family)